MKLRILLGVVLVTGLALLPGTAHAKGVSGAEVSGPGLDDSIVMSADLGEAGPSARDLAEETRLAETVFGEAPGLDLDFLEPSRPAGELGPRYQAEYTFFGPEGPRDVIIRQHLYPYARGGAVTYTPPGQRIFDAASRAGWYRAGAGLRNLLVDAGLPASPPHTQTPREATSSATETLRAAGVGVGVVMLLVRVGLSVTRRRRPRLAPAE